MSNITMIVRRLTAPSVLLVALLAVAFGAACGGGDDAPEATATAEAVATDEEPTPPPTESITIGADIWHAGWKVTLGEATLGQDELGNRTLTIDVTFENLSNRTSTFNSRIVLTSGGNSFGDISNEQDLPNVPGRLSSAGLLAIEVGDTFSLDDATLTIGNPSNNQAIVPIGPDSPDELISLEPLQIAAADSATAGPVSFTVTGVELRADLPDSSDEVEKGRLAMIVSFEVTVGEGIPIGEGVLQSGNVALKLPDGTAVAVRSDGRSGVNELLQGKEGTTIQDLSVRFIVPEPAAGQYAFVIRGPYGPDRAMVEGEVTFEVPGEVPTPEVTAP